MLGAPPRRRANPAVRSHQAHAAPVLRAPRTDTTFQFTITECHAILTAGAITRRSSNCSTPTQPSPAIGPCPHGSHLQLRSATSWRSSASHREPRSRASTGRDSLRAARSRCCRRHEGSACSVAAGHTDVRRHDRRNGEFNEMQRLSRKPWIAAQEPAPGRPYQGNERRLRHHRRSHRPRYQRTARYGGQRSLLRRCFSIRSLSAFHFHAPAGLTWPLRATYGANRELMPHRRLPLTEIQAGL